MKASSTSQQYRQQVRVVLMIEVALVAIIISLVFSFWEKVCGISFFQCIQDSTLPSGHYLLLSLVRPFAFTPITLFTIMAGTTFGTYAGTFLAVLSALYLPWLFSR